MAEEPADTLISSLQSAESGKIHAQASQTNLKPVPFSDKKAVNSASGRRSEANLTLFKLDPTRSS
jgi:hypothetical protein